MLRKERFQIIEFDDNSNVLINLANVTRSLPPFDCNKLIIKLF